jgi:hypothetical protein
MMPARPGRDKSGIELRSSSQISAPDRYLASSSLLSRWWWVLVALVAVLVLIFRDPLNLRPGDLLRRSRHDDKVIIHRKVDQRVLDPAVRAQQMEEIEREKIDRPRDGAQ